MYIKYPLNDIDYKRLMDCASSTPIGLEHIKRGALVVGTYGNSSPCIGAGYIKGVERNSDGELIANIESIERGCSLGTLHNAKLVEIPGAFHRAGLPIIVAHQATGVVIADDGVTKRISDNSDVWYATDKEIYVLEPYVEAK